MREIVLDTETTGLDAYQGHRLVEIGCVELVNRFPTGVTFHKYINPERDMPVEAFNVHGLSLEFLQAHKCFHEIADEFLEFIGDAPLVIHNAAFDHAFLCAELERVERALIARERLVDTLMLARRKHPGLSNKLDDLCLRYRIDNSKRDKHGALLDAQLLAEVYLELIGARQATLILVENGSAPMSSRSSSAPARQRPIALPARVSDDERAAHAAFIATLGEQSIWQRYAD